MAMRTEKTTLKRYNRCDLDRVLEQSHGHDSIFVLWDVWEAEFKHHCDVVDLSATIRLKEGRVKKYSANRVGSYREAPVFVIPTDMEPLLGARPDMIILTDTWESVPAA